MDQFAVLLVVYSPAGTGRSSPCFYSVDVISRSRDRDDAGEK